MQRPGAPFWVMPSCRVVTGAPLTLDVVDDVLWGSAMQAVGDLFGDALAEVVKGFLRHKGGMGRHNHSFMTKERLTQIGRFRVLDIEARARELAIFKSSQEGVIINEGAASGVDEERRGL